MVKSIVICILVWQLPAGFCKQDLNPVSATVYCGQINANGLLRTINADETQDRSTAQQQLRGSSTEATGNDAGLFVNAFCEIAR